MTCSTSLAAETAGALPGTCGHADRPGAGHVHDPADPAHRCPQGPGDRHLHRVLRDLHRPRPGRRRQADLLRRQRGVDIAGPQVLAAGRGRRPDRARAGPGPGDPAGNARRPRPSTSPSSTPTRPVTSAYWDEVVPRIRPGGVILVDNTLSHGAGHRPGHQPTPTSRHPGLQRSRGRRRPGRRWCCCRSATA